MPSVERPEVAAADLSVLCREQLGAPLAELLFEGGYSSAVFGVRLADDRQVVVKLRRWRDRLAHCYDVHRFVWERGFACPEPLAPPMRRGSVAVSFEALVPGGAPLEGGPDTPASLGRVLAELVAATPAPPPGGGLAPDVGFLRWNHDGDGLWPRATDVARDLNEVTELGWLDDYGHAVRERLVHVDSPAVIGHGDWWSENVRWENGKVLAVDDWDSTVALPEPALAGVASALFSGGASSVDEGELFLDSYATTAGADWTDDDVELAWAAGLWARLYDARKETALGQGTLVDRLQVDIAG